MKLRWLGAAGLEFQTDRQVLLIDPYLTRIPFLNQWFGTVHSDRTLIRGVIHRCGHILVTHAHWDHLMDVPEVISTTNAIAFGSANTLALLEVLGVSEENARVIHAGDRLTLGEIDVEVLPSGHGRAPGFSPGALKHGLRPPLSARDYRMDECFTFFLRMKGLTMLTDPGEHPVNLPRADLLFVSPRFDEGYYAHILSRVAPRIVIPIHWDDMWRPLSKPLRPMLAPPRWALPPFRRMEPQKLQLTMRRCSSAAHFLIPEPLKEYETADLLGLP